MSGTGVFPITAPASGAYPLSTSFSTSQSATDINNTNDVDNYAWGGVDQAPVGVRVMTTGAETYTIVSGAVTQLTGITAIDGVTVAVGDPVLVPTAPAASGVGVAISNGLGSTNPANGLYYVTAIGANITLARAATMSTSSAQPNPGGRVVFVRAGTTYGLTMWMVDSPVTDAAFTYGTTAMQWKNFQLNASTSIVPASANTLNLGSAANYWASVYTNILAFEGSNQQITGNPAFTGSPTFTGTGVPNNAIQQAGINNFNTSVQSQVVVSGTAYYITNSGLLMPATALTGMQANKTTFIWNVILAKTAAGTGTFQVAIYRGTNGTTADTQDVLQTVSAAQTAAIDTLFLEVQLTVTTTGSSGAYFWSMNARNAAGSAAGFEISASAPTWTGTKSSVALNTASLIFGLGFVSTTGTPTITVPQVQAFAYNMD